MISYSGITEIGSGNPIYRSDPFNDNRKLEDSELLYFCNSNKNLAIICDFSRKDNDKKYVFYKYNDIIVNQYNPIKLDNKYINDYKNWFYPYVYFNYNCEGVTVQFTGFNYSKQSVDTSV